jgi:hypothetical protein
LEATVIKARIPILGLLVIAAVMVVVTVTRAQMSHEHRNPSETPRVADNNKQPRCSIATIAGGWVFTTDLLYTKKGRLDGSALGTQNISNDGTLEGTYDWAGTSGFYPGNSYVGTVTVNPDCTGTISQHDVGSDVIVLQSILIAHGGQEIWGMFQDPTIDMGTFRMKRIN